MAGRSRRRRTARISTSVVPAVAASVDRLDQLPARLRFLFDYSAERALASDAGPRRGAAVARPSSARWRRNWRRRRRCSTARRSAAMAARVRARTGEKGKALFHPIRLALTGEPEGLELDVAVPAIERGALLARSRARGPARRSPVARDAARRHVRGEPCARSLASRWSFSGSIPCSRRCGPGASRRVRVADKDSAAACARSWTWPQARAFRCIASRPSVLESRARGRVHQGVVAELAEARSYGVADLVTDAAGGPADRGAGRHRGPPQPGRDPPDGGRRRGRRGGGPGPPVGGAGRRRRPRRRPGRWPTSGWPRWSTSPGPSRS